MRLLLFLLLSVGGAVAIVTGLLAPAHLRAVDPHVLRHMPAGGSLVELAVESAENNPAVAKLLVLAAEELELTGTEAAVEALRESGGKLKTNTVLARLEAEVAGRARVQEVPVLAALRPAGARERLVDSLRTIEARRVLENRDLTNTTLFAPVASAAGFPLEVAILTTAFLVEHKSFWPSLHDQVLRLSAGGTTPEKEEFYIGILSLAKRFSSAQLASLVNHLPSIESLDLFARTLQFHTHSTAVLYSAVLVSGDGAGVAQYLRRFPDSAVADLSEALARGSEPLIRLLTAGQPIFRSALYDEFAADSRLRGIFNPMLNLATRLPNLAILCKMLLLCAGAFFIVCSTRFTRVRTDPSYVWFEQLNLIRRAAAAVVLVMLLVILGEPYLAQGRAEEPARPRITFSLAALTAPPVTQPSSVMLDQHTILAVATFLVLQGLIYAICLVKLAEIRKQPVSNALKIKLLDNEENLFDGGLYCGLFGTAASLIMLTLGIIKPSLISAYSSTLFGILSVALIKIVHVRPYKRRLILESFETPNA